MKLPITLDIPASELPARVLIASALNEAAALILEGKTFSELRCSCGVLVTIPPPDDVEPGA